MDRYFFVIRAGLEDLYREEILAVSEEAAVEVATLALDGFHHFWMVATLFDETGRIVSRVANTLPPPDPLEDR